MTTTQFITLYYTEFYYTGQSVTFLSIIFLQIYGNVICTRTNFKSFFQQPTWQENSRNLYIHATELILRY